MENKKLCFDCGTELEERDSFCASEFVAHCPKCKTNYVITEMDEEEIENLKENGYEFDEDEENN